jgi:AP-2 complex subunit alpha
MVLKIAILTEKFATEYEWYIDTILRLMSQAGDHVGEEVWYRIVQIVTNTEELQEYAARKIIEHLRQPVVHENLVKVGAYLLGEFGHLIANDDGLNPIDQFQLLHAKSNLCSPATRALLLTTYVKWLNLFPEIRAQIIAVFQRYRHVLDAELQQRACEYLAIAARPDEDLLQIVCDEMPPFPERESALLSRLLKRHGAAAGDKRTWNIGGRDVNKDKDDERYRGMAKRKNSRPIDGVVEGGEVDAPAHSNGVVSGTSAPVTDDVMGSLAGLDLSGDAGADAPGAPLQPLIATNGAPAESSPTLSRSAPVNGSDRPLSPISTAVSPSSSSAAPTPISARATSAPVVFTHGSEKWLNRLIYANEGVLYEDAQLQVGLKSEYHGANGRLALYFGNKITASLDSFTVTVESAAPEALVASMPKIPSSTLAATTQVQQIVQVECRDLFVDPPILRISYLAGSLQTMTLRLPVYVTKFIEPVALGATDYFERWRQIGGPPREAQRIFPLRMGSGGGLDLTRHAKVVKGCRLAVLEGIDPNPNNIVGAGVLHMAEAGKVGCLIRLEPNAEAKVRACQASVTTAADSAPPALSADGPVDE